MKDLVRVFQEYATTASLQFEYGSEAHINLLKGDLNPETIYLLLFPVKRRGIQNTGSIRIQARRYLGKFLLVKGSDYSKHYFTENNNQDTDSKYTLNVEPLIDNWETIGNAIMCLGLELQLWENDDAIDVLDANKDGLWCTFNIVQRP